MDNFYYYRAKIKKEEIVHFVALFRSIEDGIAFDRIENPRENVFEFFVAYHAQFRFVEIMDLFLKYNIIQEYHQDILENSSLYSYR